MTSVHILTRIQPLDLRSMQILWRPSWDDEDIDKHAAAQPYVLCSGARSSSLEFRNTRHPLVFLLDE